MLDKAVSTRELLALIPDNEVADVIQAGQRHSRDSWEWGDRSLRWIEILMGSGVVFTKEAVYRLLSELSGIGMSTLRGYADHAAFYDADARDEFDQLPYAHFVIARRFGHRWREVLQHSKNHFEKAGRFLAAETLEWFFSTNAQPAIQAQEESSAAVREFSQDVAEVSRSVTGDGSEVKLGQGAARYWLSKLESSLVVMARLLDMLPVSADARENLARALQEFRAACEEALVDLELDR